MPERNEGGNFEKKIVLLIIKNCIFTNTRVIYAFFSSMGEILTPRSLLAYEPASYCLFLYHKR